MLHVFFMLDAVGENIMKLYILQSREMWIKFRLIDFSVFIHILLSVVFSILSKITVLDMLELRKQFI